MEARKREERMNSRKSRIGEIVKMAAEAVKAGLATAEAIETAYEDMGKPGFEGLTKILIIGSQGLYPEMKEHEMEMIKQGYAAKLPKMDWHGETVEEIIEYNKASILEADIIHLFWDGRSTGTILDLGMVIALNKPLKIIELERKSIAEYIEKYAARFEGEDHARSDKGNHVNCRSDINVDNSSRDCV